MSTRRRTEPVAVCSVCGREAPCRGTSTGTPICSACRSRGYVEPVAVCSACGRERRCRGARTDTPLCSTCRHRNRPKWVPPVRTCVACGKTAPCVYAHSDRPMCRSCAGRQPSRRESCAFCGTLAIAAARTGAGAECSSCRSRRLRSKITCGRCQREARPSAGQPGVCERCAGERVAQVCQSCGAEEQNYAAGQCAACSLRAVLDELARTADPAAVAAMRGYLTALAASPKPHSTLNWITTSPGFQTVRELLGGTLPLTHEALDQLERGESTRFLRAELVKRGALPARSERAALLALLIERELLRVPDASDRTHLRAFATWKVHHDFARKERQGTASRHSDLGARAKVRVAADLLVWLAEHKLTLATLRQEHLDWWLANGTGHRRHARAFIAWTSRHNITARLDVLPPTTLRHTDPLDPQHRRELLRALLVDGQLDLRDRVAGLLIVLCSQRISHLVLLRTDDVHERDGLVHLAIGRDPLLLPEPVATLTRQLTHASDSGWLFHGGRDGNHLSEAYMRERLGRLGVKALPARTAATSRLARRLPAAILADLLGFSDVTTERWTKQAAGDWTRYAASRAATTP